MSFRFPKTIAEVTPAMLSALVADAHPGASVDGFDVVECRGLSQNVSTAGRAVLDLRYGAGSPPLPRRAVLKMVIDQAGAPGVLYETEVQIYKRMLPSLNVEQALFLGGVYDPESEQFGLLLEDLTSRGASFPNALESDVSPAQVSAVLDLLAAVHAHYWNSPALDAERGWLSSLVDGRQFEFFEGATVAVIDELVAKSAYRQALIARVGRPPAVLWENVKAVHRFHARLPQTLLHGDTGVHNTYRLPDGRVGMVDWQLSVRGAWPHDVHYIICTALTVEDRRAHERDLVRGYLARLAALGVTDLPALDEAMREYARAIVWGFTIGWLMAGDENYGTRILQANLDRLITAALDLDTFALADEVM